MKAYSIDYEVNGRLCTTVIDARSLDSAKNKLARKHQCKNSRQIKIKTYAVIGYF